MPMLFAFEALAPEMFATEALGAEALGTAAELGTAALGVGEMAGLGAEAFGGAAAGAPGVSQAAMAADAAAGGAGAGGAGVNAAQVAAQQEAATQATTRGLASVPQAIAPASAPYAPLELTNNPLNSPFPEYFGPQTAASPITPSAPPMGIEGQIPANQFIEPGSGGINSLQNTIAQANVPITPPSTLESAFNKAMSWSAEHPFPAMAGAYMGANALGLLKPTGATFNDKPYDGPLSRYKLSPNFQGSTANPLDFQYKPRYAEGGGIMGADPMMNTDIQVGSGENIRNYAEGDLVNEDFLLANNPQGIQGADQYGQGAGMGYLQMGGNYGAAPVMSEDQRRYERDSAMNNMSMNNNPQGLKGADPYGQGAGMGYVQGYASGGSLSDSIASYQKMLGGQPQAAPTPSRDVGIYYDLDPDTRYQDALTAAQIRQSKVNQRAYVSPPIAKRPTPMGKLNMPTSAKSKDSSSADVEARRGGIMHSSLGGYAAGGNPRLLQGPGDGMSDNIPATINGRQPARLADGEFVVPADVVSHLGNGSTEAGAKQLHGMMDKVRKARTGNPKQGKEINPQKYMPK